MYGNPFTPVFGNEPPVLAGRETLIADVLRGLENAPGDPNRVVMFTGPRGSGKTVLLNRIGNLAEGMGWIAVHTLAAPGMLDEIKDQLERKAAGFLPKRDRSRITGLQISGIGGSREFLPEKELGWRAQMDAYLDALDEQKVGLLFTVDEVKADVEDMISFVSTFQFFIREKRNVALLMAGLPHEVLQMFQDRTISFVRRAFLRKLEPVSLPEVRATMKKTIELSGRSIGSKALDEAANSTMGLPFVIQLIGYHAFNQSQRKTVSLDDVQTGIKDAKEDMEHMVLDASLQELTPTEKRFLSAMLSDGETSRVADIAERMGVTPSSASHYKRRLINQGILHDAGRGLVAFNMPMLKTLLAERDGEST
jgi:energy-coupling factor transporter ATP-binding protein EcfA2